jgi:hypothetical protein
MSDPEPTLSLSPPPVKAVPAAGGGIEQEDALKAPPWHSKLPSDRRVYHDETRCTEGNNIERYNRVSGTGGRPKCSHCRQISG